MNLKLLRPVILLLAFMMLCSAVFAQSLIVDADPSQSDPNILGFRVAHSNVFHQSDFTGGVPQSPFTIQFVDSAGRVYESYPLRTGTNDIDFTHVRSIRVVLTDVLETGAEPLFSRAIDFCNNDGVCQPCYGSNCGLIESYLVCPDCPSGSRDYYCDLKRDDVCDPDCDGFDGDCPGCGSFCAYEDATCTDLGGVMCSPGQDCRGGEFSLGLQQDGVLVADCCLRGTCAEFGQAEERDYMAEAFGVSDQPKGSLPPGELPQIEEGIDVRVYIVGVLLLFVVLIIILIVHLHKKESASHGSDIVSFVRSDVRDLFSKGHSRAEIKQALLVKGYPPDLIDKELDLRGVPR